MLSAVAVIALAAAPSLAPHAAKVEWQDTHIEEFMNPAGAKQWDENCQHPMEGADRVKDDVNNILDAKLSDDGCVTFMLKGKRYWIKETAISHSGPKSSKIKVCERVASAQGSGGGTVEAATMGMGGSATSCSK